MELHVHESNRMGRERGFTFIEIIVVSLVLVILAAIAIPTFLGQRDRAFEAAVVADLRNAGAARAYLVVAGTEPASSTPELPAGGSLGARTERAQYRSLSSKSKQADPVG